MYSIIYDEEASQDLAEIFVYYNEQGGFYLADKIYSKIKNSISSLKEMPSRCPKVHFLDKVYKLNVIGLPYLVYFMIDDEEKNVIILHILHSSRKQENFFKN